MSSKKEEERNEKIIRGLMKLPPNRRCINCNAVGPQYVCTTFWSFVCMPCSGIHREFTHRVKSISMSKFTSQEVEALQNGGNQRAREIYLKGWDPHRRFPDNSNVEKVRAFIKNVYVDKNFAAEKLSDKPPRDLQNQRSLDETRRASSYHSYSQSPPNDFQYEERRYGKRALVLSRKIGSERGLYEGKLSSFLSPGRLSDHIYEDRFANEGSNPRMSDYSASNRGDPFRSDTQSPNSQKDVGSPFSETSADGLQHHTGRDGGRTLGPQRTISSGSFGSFDSNSVSFKSVTSVGLVDVASEPEQSTSSSLSHPSVPGGFGGLDLFSAPFAPQNITSVASSSDNSQFPESRSTTSLNSFQPPSLTGPTISSGSAHQPAQKPSSLDLFTKMPQQVPTATVNEKSTDAVSQNEGWATFDFQNVTPVGIENATPVTMPSSHANSVGNFDPPSHAQWAPFEEFAAHRPPLSPHALWKEGPQNVQSSFSAASNQWSSFENFSANGPFPMTPTEWNGSQNIVDANSNTTIGVQSWNAFEDSNHQLPTQSNDRRSEQVEMQQHPSVADHHLDIGAPKDSSSDGTERAEVDTGHPFSGISSHVSMPFNDFSKHPMGEAHPFESDHKSTNPFDFPYDSDIESANTTQFWEMSSLQAALPNGDMPNSFAGGLTQPWFPASPETPYVPTGPQGALGFMATQAPSTQMPNVQTQGPVASVGGNPFA